MNALWKTHMRIGHPCGEGIDLGEMRHRAYPRGIGQADKQRLMAILGNEWPKATEPLQDHGQGPQPPATWRKGPWGC